MFLLSLEEEGFVRTSLGCSTQTYYSIINRFVLETRSIELQVTAIARRHLADIY